MPCGDRWTVGHADVWAGECGLSSGGTIVGVGVFVGGLRRDARLDSPGPGPKDHEIVALAIGDNDAAIDRADGPDGDSGYFAAPHGTGPVAGRPADERVVIECGDEPAV